MFWETQQGHMIASVVYSLIGVGIFALAFVLMERITPFSIRRELAEDNNIAVGIVLSSIVIGLSIIISAAIGA